MTQIFHGKLVCYIKAFTRLFTVLKIVVKERETAYTIFGTLSNRGKDLTDSDIIKNEIFQSVEEERSHLIKNKWDSIIESIENEDLTGYIRFHFASQFKPIYGILIPFKNIKKIWQKRY